VEGSAAPRRRARALIGLVAASGLVYPMLLAAVELVFAQVLQVDVVAVVLWLLLAVVCSVGFVAAVRWGASRRVRSLWLLLGLAPPALYELWLFWPMVTG
jgi:hypothetical protein